ncbi:hypothetical protein THAOC_36015 [Thalassiosira oceanica]|uniref:Fatty acid desaturase domain-containing protein n=1 Tax=Thalassiosira oceanica TaxID=159749 RepID=K0R929_THAOC|nr:hypothetical protein THAOC_36015 [Thalassiosira oceanica]|mmetsp:Transcript_36269/g.81573  ORF Transcript_36269/g.81573 Transcript_36269/m.81573 type:complete len:417 (-) Transcript_36269:110-1360(-)|eukprot:EJK45371.1 hypothetical protein THAOC_36015 [Thalassiosira oceanica]
MSDIANPGENALLSNHPSNSLSQDEESPSKQASSQAAMWHRTRRNAMMRKYGDKIGPLERDSSSNALALSLLLTSNASLFGLSLLSGRLPWQQVFLLALFPGSMFSLWTLQILHDLLHGSLLDKRSNSFLGLKKSVATDRLMFWGSMPSAFGYYLYLKYGHLTHHKNLGDPSSASLKQLFESDRVDFEDGDVLFVSHRMKLKGEVGPAFQVGGRNVTMSISKAGFNSWKEGKLLRNVIAFATSFMYERMMLTINDAVVAVTGRNYFFPNKPEKFHRECANYCRCAVAIRALLWKIAGWKSLLFLYLSETLWSIPPHPASAMFVSNHGSSVDESGQCIPSSSTYAGRWYSIFTLFTNYHCEHHDFPQVPLHRLGELRRIAPEFYPKGSKDNVFRIMAKAFTRPDFYACMDSNIQMVS